MALQQRKKLGIVFVILTMIGLGTIIFSIWYFNQGKGFVRYVDEGGIGFELKYPGDWTTAPYSNGTNLIIFSPLENAMDSFKENINIVVQDLNSDKVPMNLNKYTQIAISQMQVVFKANFELLESKDIMFAGVPGHQIVFLGKNPEAELKFKCIWALKGDRAYQFTYGAIATKYDLFIDKVDAMIRSFKMP